MDDSTILRSMHRGHIVEVVLSQGAGGWRASWTVCRITPFALVAKGMVDAPCPRVDKAHAAAKHAAVAWVDEHVEPAKEVVTRRTPA